MLNKLTCDVVTVITGQQNSKNDLRNFLTVQLSTNIPAAKLTTITMYI